MQPNENFTFLFEITILFTLVLFISRTIYLRLKRKALIAKYKKSPRYKELETLLSTKRFVIAQILALLVAVKTIFDIKNILDKYGESVTGQLLFIVCLSAIGFLITFSLIYYLFKKNDLIIKP